MMMNSKTAKRKGEKERERVKNIGEEYEAISKLLGINSRRINKVNILETALEFIHQHHGTRVELPGSKVEIVKIEVVSASQDYPPHAHTPPAPPPVTTPPTSTDNSNLLFCLEEVDDSVSDEEEITQQPMVIPRSTSPAAAQYKFCNYTPGTNAVIFSPNSPWLTSSSPQITNVFSENFSPPLQPLQATPKLHHLSPPISNSMVSYSPCMPMPNSPQFLGIYTTSSDEFHWAVADN